MITSRHNPAIKRVRALSHRRARDQTGLYLAEGIRLVAQALTVGATIQELIVAPELLTSDFARRLVERSQAAGLPCLIVTSDAFQYLSVREHAQGLAAVVRQRWTQLTEIRPTRDARWVALNEVQDPGNLGSILRTSDAVGAEGVILLGPSTDPHDPTAVRASMGAIFTQRLVRASFAEFMRWASDHNCAVVGAAGDAALDYHTYRYPAPCALLMGSEQHGLTAEQLATCGAVVRIPMLGGSDSLNLAVATSVILYEAFNQQRVLSLAQKVRSGQGAGG
ncbi:MAG: TrmH family RNA methyltransferase [Ktedonobacterales bacterium]